MYCINGIVLLNKGFFFGIIYCMLKYCMKVILKLFGLVRVKIIIIERLKIINFKMKSMFKIRG